jgi:hypothetical protein
LFLISEVFTFRAHLDYIRSSFLKFE